MTDLLIIDGRHLVWRSANAFEQLYAELPGGEVVGTGVIHGFVHTLLRVHGKHGGRVYIAWEGVDNFRTVLYPDYKKRPEVDEDMAERIADMRAQEAQLKGFLHGLGVRQWCGYQCEADDVIGTLCARAEEMDLEALVYSGDGDLHQLVSDNVRVLAPERTGEKLYGPYQVKRKWGVWPKRVPDHKALAGDTSDGIPGVRGVGPKTAVKLLTQYESAEAVAAAAKAEDPAWCASEKLRKATAEADVALFKTLATIKRDAKLLRAKAGEVPRPNSLLMLLKLKSLMTPEAQAGLRRLGG